MKFLEEKSVKKPVNTAKRLKSGAAKLIIINKKNGLN